jgi:lactoylglutathione lyase
MRVEHVALWVHDLERMRGFYVASLGGRSGPRYHNPGTGLSSYFISFGDGCRVELMQGPAVQPRPDERTAGYAHVAFSLGGRHEVDAAVEALRQRGVTIASGPRTTGDGYYEAVIVDPEGNHIELAE